MQKDSRCSEPSAQLISNKVFNRLELSNVFDPHHHMYCHGLETFDYTLECLTNNSEQLRIRLQKKPLWLDLHWALSFALAALAPALSMPWQWMSPSWSGSPNHLWVFFSHPTADNTKWQRRLGKQLTDIY